MGRYWSSMVGVRDKTYSCRSMRLSTRYAYACICGEMIVRGIWSWRPSYKKSESEIPRLVPVSFYLDDAIVFSLIIFWFPIYSPYNYPVFSLFFTILSYEKNHSPTRHDRITRYSRLLWTEVCRYYHQSLSYGNSCCHGCRGDSSSSDWNYEYD